MKLGRSVQSFLLLGLAAGLLAGCGSDSAFITAVPEQPPAGISVDEYHFQVGDEFDVTFLGNEQFDISLIVRPDGRVSLPLAEDLLVAGMTPAELNELITELYRREIREPEVNVNVRGFAGQRVWIAGEVLAPGPMVLRGRMTALQAIFEAGGPRASANLDEVVVVRRSDAERVTLMFKINVEDRLDGEPGEDFVLQPYDAVFVPKTAITEINEFVAQYISSMMPDFLRFGFTFNYPLHERKVDIDR